MSCFFCDGSRVALVYNSPFRNSPIYSIGTMTLMRRYDGELTFEVKIDDDVEFDFDSESVDGNFTAHVAASGNIDHIKYCPFCGQKLQED